MDTHIKYVDEGSIAQKKGILPGDELLSINGEKIEDYIDYAYFMGEKKLSLALVSPEGKKRTVKIKKIEDEDIGITFVNSGLDKKYTCRNKCLFCFVDQLPSYARQTLRFKDDDWRLSFLMGNYVTLTNLDMHQMHRILQRKVSPIYVSVHATDDEVRKKLLTNRFAGGIMSMLETMTSHGIKIHTQIVMCPEINDGEVLRKSIIDLYSLYPGVQSLAVVPAGLTKFRENLFPLKKVTPECACAAIDMIEDFQKKFLGDSGTRFVFASDEMYIKAHRELPKYDEYEDFCQIENGVGLVAQFLDEANYAFDDFEEMKYKEVSVATGVDFYPYMKEIAKKLEFVYNIKVNVYPIINNYFGNTITVSGLLTAQDVTEQLFGKELGDVLLLPGSMFKEFETVTLDDKSLSYIEEKLGVKCIASPNDGYEFIRTIAKEEI